MKKIVSCFIIKLDKEEIAKYAINVVKEYEQIAYIHGTELKEYYEKKLNITKKEFMQKCYDESEERIKEYIAIGAIAKKENISCEEGNSNEEKTYLVIENTVKFLKNINYKK